MQILPKQGRELDLFVAEIESECSEVQFVKCRRIVGKITGSMLLDGMSYQTTFPI